MIIFTLSNRLINDYANFIQSYLTVQDETIHEFLQEELIEKGSLWPEALLQLNPAYEITGNMVDLCAVGLLQPSMKQIFYDSRHNHPFRLYRHQQEAIERGVRGEPFIVTIGTGSGKTPTYFIPIYENVLKHNLEQYKVQAIVVYPMNALINSPYDASQRLGSSYRQRTGREQPVHYSKYTDQKCDHRAEIQCNPPHILLTNYVMLELMMVRSEERNFVDRTATRLQFISLDEMPTYRGRQGADVAQLVRRLKEGAEIRT